MLVIFKSYKNTCSIFSESSLLTKAPFNLYDGFIYFADKGDMKGEDITRAITSLRQDTCNK